MSAILSRCHHNHNQDHHHNQTTPRTYVDATTGRPRPTTEHHAGGNFSTTIGMHNQTAIGITISCSQETAAAVPEASAGYGTSYP